MEGRQSLKYPYARGSTGGIRRLRWDNCWNTPMPKDQPLEEEVRNDRTYELLMVGVITVLTLSCVLGIKPPRGMWREASSNYTVGKSVMADDHSMSYYGLLAVVTIIHVTSLAIILIQVSVICERSWKAWTMTIWILVVCIIMSYKISIMKITPNLMQGKVTSKVYFIMGFGGLATTKLIIYPVKKEVKMSSTMLTCYARVW